MEMRELGRTGLKVSALGFGGAELGFDDGVQVETVNLLLNEALDAGLNVIDTANAYKASEELIGRAVAHRRQQFHLFSKCGATAGFTQFDWSIEGITVQLEQSLRALRTDHLDLLQLHSCSIEELDRGDAIEALQRARAGGKVRFIGYSGDGLAAVHAVQLGVFDTLQTSINIADQQVLDMALPAARAAGMGVIAKRPIANAAWRTGQLPASEYHHSYFHRLRALDYDFLRWSIDESVAHALRFTLSQPGVSTAIVGTSKTGRWARNAKAIAAGALSAAEIGAITTRWAQVAAPDWIGQV